MNEILHQAGFFGTSANFAADFTLVMMILIASLFTAGVVLAVKKKYDTHRWVQTTAAILNAIMVLWMMISMFAQRFLRAFVYVSILNKL